MFGAPTEDRVPVRSDACAARPAQGVPRGRSTDRPTRADDTLRLVEHASPLRRGNRLEDHAPLRRVCGRLVFRFGRGFTHGSAGARSTFTTSEGNVVEFVYYDSTVTRTRETTSTTSRFVDHGPPPDARVLDDPRVQGHHQLCELRCGAEGARARTRRSSPAAALLGSPEAAPRRRPSLAGHGGEPKAPAESRKSDA